MEHAVVNGNGLNLCPDCGVRLPPSDGPIHRYIGASAACWALYSALLAGQPPVAPGAHNELLVDAYAAQHPGTPSNQARQSVTVHLLTLYGVLERGVEPGSALWLRSRALRDGRIPKHDRFAWLQPPKLAGGLTILDIVQQPTPEDRAATLQRYVNEIWARWAAIHRATVVAWYDQWIT